MCYFVNYSASQFLFRFFFHHIKSIKHKNKLHSIIVFKNFKELTVNISYHSLKNQMLKTSYCIVFLLIVRINSFLCVRLSPTTGSCLRKN
ncbi:competence protein ComK [Halalkalibacter flavus]|uniref:competence protein ComK n=1 Tax=Halalkalibacter flavus TaxID=3090668 RepID=UPI003D665A5C